MAERRKKKTRLSALAVRLGLVCLMAYLVVALVSAQVDLVAKRQQLDSVTQQVQQQQTKNDELQRTLGTDDENAYVERIARDKLGYALPDERIYVDMSGQ